MEDSLKRPREMSKVSVRWMEGDLQKEEVEGTDVLE